jgi:hypothetical protein
VDLLAASGLLFLAAMTRYELWFVNATLALYLTYRGFIRRDLGLGQVILNGALLAAFPIYWVLHSYAYFGDLHIFSQASRQFIDLYGRNHIEAMKLNVATDLVRDAAFDPLLILGASLTGFLALQRREMRDWAILFFAPLLALAVQMAISLGVPLAASFRIDGPWVLLLLPAGAFGLVFAAEKVTANETRRWIVLAFATYVAMVPSGLETHMLAKAMQAPGVLDGDDLALGRYLRRLAAHDGHRILLDAVGSLDYLNVPVAANLPDRVTLDVDEEPVAVATFMDARKTYEARHNEAVIERYLTDKFHLADGLDVAKLKVRNIGYLVVQYPPFLRALDRNPRVTKTAGFGKWVVYALKP